MKSNVRKFLLKSIALLSLTFISCNLAQKDYYLGCNLYIMDGDRVEDRIIVYCTSNFLNDCYGGIYVVPTYNRHMKNGKYSEYVENAISNDACVLVKTKQIELDKYNYWIIIKDQKLNNLTRFNLCNDSIIQSYVYGPVDDPRQFSNIREILNMLH